MTPAEREIAKALSKVLNMMVFGGALKLAGAFKGISAPTDERFTSIQQTWFLVIRDLDPEPRDVMRAGETFIKDGGWIPEAAEFRDRLRAVAFERWSATAVVGLDENGIERLASPVHVLNGRIVPDAGNGVGLQQLEAARAKALPAPSKEDVEEMKLRSEHLIQKMAGGR